MVRNITGSDPSLKIMELYGAIFKMVGSAIGQAWSAFSAISGFFHPILATVAAVDLMLTVIFALFILYLCLTGLAEIAGLILTGPFLCAVAVPGFAMRATPSLQVQTRLVTTPLTR